MVGSLTNGENRLRDPYRAPPAWSAQWFPVNRESPGKKTRRSQDRLNEVQP